MDGYGGSLGYMENQKLKETWRILRTLNNLYKKPWLCLGDFNEILFGHEKEGGSLGQNYVWSALGTLWNFVDLKI
jgi:hypothetical protein